MGSKIRLDLLMMELKLAPSRERAQSLIMAGKVLVDDHPVTKPGQSVSIKSLIRLRGEEHPYVSRAGVKLENALTHFNLKVLDRVALDIGSSTGGFTQVLLLRGARQVFSVDVGHNQMDWSIRNDPRVSLQEGVNARYLEFEQIGTQVGVIVMDVSFISQTKILPALIQFSTLDTDWVTLVKPQFEVGPDRVGKGGIVREEKDRLDAVAAVTTYAESIGLKRLGLVESSLKGTDGNQEYLAHWKRIKE